MPLRSSADVLRVEGGVRGVEPVIVSPVQASSRVCCRDASGRTLDLAEEAELDFVTGTFVNRDLADRIRDMVFPVL